MLLSSIFQLFASLQLLLLLLVGAPLYVPVLLLRRVFEIRKYLNEESTTTTTTQPTTKATAASVPVAPAFTTCSATPCGICKDVTATGGTIQSPNFPNVYPNNANCVFSIGVPTGKKIKLTFSSFVLDSNDDLLSVFDGPSITSTVLLSATTGTVVPLPVTSSSNSMAIKFVSDSVSRHGKYLLLDFLSARPYSSGQWAATYLVV